MAKKPRDVNSGSENCAMIEVHSTVRLLVPEESQHAWWGKNDPERGGKRVWTRQLPEKRPSTLPATQQSPDTGRRKLSA